MLITVTVYLSHLSLWYLISWSLSVHLSLFRVCPFFFFFLFLCLTLSNLISSCLPLLICLPPSFLTPKTSVPKNHVRKTCTWAQVWLEHVLSKRASRLGVDRHKELHGQQLTLCWKPRQILNSCNKGAFLDLLPSLFLPNQASERKGRSWLLSHDFRAEDPGSAAC